MRICPPTSSRRLKAHPDPVLALRRMDAARHGARLAASGGRPMADIRGSVRAGSEKTMYTDRERGDIDPFAAEARISWELDLSGRIRNAKDAAVASEEMTKADLAGVRLMLAADIARSLFEASAVKEALRLELEAEEETRRMLTRAEAREKAGLADVPEVAVLRARFEHAKHARMASEIRMEKILNRLASLTGEKIELEDLPELTEYRSTVRPGVRSRSENGRPSGCDGSLVGNDG